MRFSPTKILQGLLCTTPILVLALAACGGGGSGSTTTPPLAAAYTVGGAVSGVSGSGLVLRNNGGDDLTVASGVSAYTFSTSVVAGASYKVTVLKNPSTPQICTFDNPAAASGVMPAYNLTNVNVTCVPAFTLSVNLTSLDTTNGNTVVLQNNGGDNLLLSANGIVAFNTPLADLAAYSVTVLTQPVSPAQTCSATTSPNGNISGASATVTINCAAIPTPAPDGFVYTANNGAASVSAFSAASGVLTAKVVGNAGSGPSAVAADGSGHVYTTNQSANTISGFLSTSGNLYPLIDVDGGTASNQSSIATGPTPVAIKIHPSGKFAYVVNSGVSGTGANSVSAYSIDATTGALTRIDTDGATAGTQYFIPARVTPVSIAIDPAGKYAYVANAGSNLTTPNSIVVYSIDATSGALANIQVVPTGTGSTPYSIAIDPAGAYAYVANGGTGTVTSYAIASNGTLTTRNSAAAGISPRSVKVDPSGTHVYVVNSSSGDVSVYAVSSGAFTTQIDCAAGGYTGGCNSKNFLTGTGTSTTSPKSISIDSSGKYAYVANTFDNTVSAFSIDGAGGLTSIGTTTTGLSPYSVITVK